MARYDDEDDIDVRKPVQKDLTPVDWLLCILCSGIGCIIGIIRVIQGDPTGGKMIGISLVFVIIWTALRFVFESAIR